MKKDYLKTNEIRDYIEKNFSYAVSDSTIGKWRYDRYRGKDKGPVFYRHGYKEVRYRIADVDAWAREMGISK